MEVEFHGQYDKVTYFKAIRWIYKPSKRTLALRLVLSLVFLLIVVFYAITVSRDSGVSGFELSRILRYSLTLLVLAYIIFQPFISATISASRLWADPITRRRISGRFSSIGIQIDPSKDWLLWDSFVKIHRSDDLIVLVTAAWIFVILPRQFFKDDREWKILQDMVLSKVKEVIGG